MKAITNKSVLIAAIGVLALVAAIFAIQYQTSYGHVTSNNQQIKSSVSYTFFATSTNQDASGIYSTTTSATSTNITAYLDSNGRLDSGFMNIEGASRVMTFCERGDKLGGGNTGSTLCRFQVSDNGSDWFYFDRMNNATTSSTITPAAMSGTSTMPYALDLTSAAWKFLRCTVKEVTDGSHECRAVATFD